MPDREVAEMISMAKSEERQRKVEEARKARRSRSSSKKARLEQERWRQEQEDRQRREEEAVEAAASVLLEKLGIDAVGILLDVLADFDWGGADEVVRKLRKTVRP